MFSILKLAALAGLVGVAHGDAGAAEIKSIGYILLEGFEVLDVFGPLSPLNYLSFTVPLNLSLIHNTLEPVSTKPVTVSQVPGSNFGELVLPTHTLENAPDLDVLIVPGGGGTRMSAEKLQPYFDFVRERYPSLKYLISVCTGATILTRSGVLDGRKATTNKAAWVWATSTGPYVDWVPKARWVVDGNIWTTSGVSAGLDGIYAFVEHVWGPEQATRLANAAEYERHQDPSWDPFSDVFNVTKPPVQTPPGTTSTPVPTETAA
ncbi:class I glutamine amidotransferase-like protein [Auriculariales sp. MPI-PUGE-AT-0066]|nr:class I glutamine amidotransferase-like protein [Auriculariales sp. MPI-PUGE-AT-0066]